MAHAPASDLERLVAMQVDPIAFDRVAFDASATIFTKPGDFERRQERAHVKARAIIEIFEKLGNMERAHGAGR